MSYVLKLQRDPVWLDLSLSTGCGVVALLSEDGYQVSVPAALLLAVSPLLRSMVSDLHPAAQGPLVLSVVISGDVLLLVGDILTKGVAFVKGDTIKGEVQGVLKMMGVDVFLDSVSVSDEVVNGGRSDEIKLEILVKLESVDENTTTDCILNKKKKNLEELLKDSLTSNEVENRRISKAEEYTQQCADDVHHQTRQGADNGGVDTQQCDDDDLNLKIVNLKSIDVDDFNDQVNIQVLKPVRSRKSKENTQKQKPAGDKRFECEDCQFYTELRNSKANHIRTHSAEKPFQCEHCDYSTARSDSLLIHTRKHTGVKLFYCEYCDYSTAHSGNLAVHVRKHTGEKPFKCGDCDYRAVTSRDLKRHKITHPGEKLFQCEYSDFSKARRDSLLFHTRKHTGLKLFYCEYCDYCTVLSGNLSVHVRKHTGEKPFKCGDCDYRAVTSSHLKKHKRTHSGEKPFQWEEQKVDIMEQLDRPLKVMA